MQLEQAEREPGTMVRIETVHIGDNANDPLPPPERDWAKPKMDDRKP
jgi:hypothetical protein